MDTSGYQEFFRGPRAALFRVERPRADAKVCLYCFHHAGGTSALYNGWGERLPGFVEVRSLMLPGREALYDQPPLESVQAIVDALVDELARATPGAYALLGHSFGGLLAFETAHALTRRGRPPMHLFVTGSRAPDTWTSGTSQIHRLPLHLLVEELRRFGGTPEMILNDTEIMEALAPLIRADFRAVRDYAYHPRPVLPSPITAFAGLDDAIVPRNTVRAWERHTGSSFVFHLIGGDHFFVKRSAQCVLRVVESTLGKHTNL